MEFVKFLTGIILFGVLIASTIATTSPKVGCAANDTLIWKQIRSGEQIPSNALVGGYEIWGNGPNDIFVARTPFDGHILVAKVQNPNPMCLTPYNGRELIPFQCEVLIDDGHFEWSPSSNGEVPMNAVIGGVSRCGELLYVGRVKHEEHLIVGLIWPSLGVINVSFGYVYSYAQYEVLVRNDE